MDSSSNALFSNNNLTCFWKVNSEVMTPMEAIGERMIKRFAGTIDSNPKKIYTGKITLLKKAPKEDEETSVRPENDSIGLREDYKRLLKTNQGYPWDQIAEIEVPHFQELLISLYLLKKCDQRTMDFALFTAKKNSPTTMQILGKILFLAERFPKFKISLDDYDQSIERIYESYYGEINKTVESLYKHYQSHKKTAVQSPEIALMTQVAIELSKLLLTEKGAVNFAIIPSLIEFFIDEPVNPMNHEISIMSTFKQLLESPTIREKIAKITKPESPISPSNLVIRAVLDLPENIIPTDLHAQQTALSGLLSHVRQGLDGSCFATPLVMGLLSSHLELCLDDFSLLLSKGKLTRKVHQVTRDFPFLLRMNNKSLNTQIALKRNGEILHHNKDIAYIWEIPGFIKACEALNVKDNETLFKKMIAQFFQNEEKYIESKSVSVRHILQEMAKLEANNRSEKHPEVGLIFSIAYFAFEGQICNPLLGVWENSIAGMSEGEEGSIVTSTIIKTTLKVLNDKLKEMAPNEITQRKKIKKEMKKILCERIQLHYDPIIHHTSHSKDQHTTEGAFVLYDKGEYSRATSWIRVDTPLEFSAFVSRVIEKTRQNIGSPAYESLFDSLLNYATTESFLQQVLALYFNKQPKIPRSLSQYKKLKYTPWITKSGNNFSKVMQVYFEFPQDFKSSIITPLNPQDLFLKLANYSRNMPNQEKEKYRKNAKRCILARIPGVHAFSLMPGHPSFYQAWSSEVDLEKWLNEKVVTPAMKVSKSIISNDLRKKMISYMQDWIIDQEQMETFKIHVKQLKSNMTIQEFRNSMVQLAGLSGRQLQLFDASLYEHLPDDFKKLIGENAIHFADTNWGNGLNDLHFSFVCNPGSGNLEIWTVHDDNSGMEPLDQPLWLQEWEIFSCSDFKK